VTGPPAAAGEASVREELDLALRRAMSELDAEIWKDPSRLRAVLADLCPTRALYIQVLYQVAEFGVTAALAESRASGTTALSLSALRMQVKRLTSKTGLSDDLAEWGVRAWSTALGLAVVPERRRKELAIASPAPAADPALSSVSVPPPPRGRSSRHVPAPAWAAAAILAGALILRGIYPLPPGRSPLHPPGPQPAASAEPGGLSMPLGGWADPSQLARLQTIFVGQRQLDSGLRQTVVLEIRAIVARGGLGRFLYVLNEGRWRRDNAGTLWLADGKVELPDLGTGHLGLDPAGRPSMVDAGAAGGAPSRWRLKAVR
jgi:hypothetical protein